MPEPTAERAEHAPPHHAASVRTYVLIFAALLVLTVTTVAVNVVTRETVLHVPVALAIAVTKAALVVLFFMHALQSSRLTWVVIAGSVLFVGIMVSLTMSDYLSRHWLLD